MILFSLLSFATFQFSGVLGLVTELKLWQLWVKCQDLRRGNLIICFPVQSLLMAFLFNSYLNLMMFLFLFKLYFIFSFSKTMFLYSMVNNICIRVNILIFELMIREQELQTSPEAHTYSSCWEILIKVPNFARFCFQFDSSSLILFYIATLFNSGTAYTKKGVHNWQK